jgi:histidine triad (HIT) family protein
MQDCVFCRIVAGELPASIVHEDDASVAFMDIGCVNPGHTLVVVKPHVESLVELDEALAGAVFRAVARVAKAVKAAFGPPGLSVYQANGQAAGQTVFHIHVHVVPRWEDDAMAVRWPATNPSRETLAEHAARIRAALTGAADSR